MPAWPECCFTSSRCPRIRARLAREQPRRTDVRVHEVRDRERHHAAHADVAILAMDLLP
jgi:hypothetical protein